jgi:membrane protein implicated in regulation of membrane protease activity
MLAFVMLTMLALWLGVFFVFFRSARRDSKRDAAERGARVPASEAVAGGNAPQI